MGVFGKFFKHESERPVDLDTSLPPLPEIPLPDSSSPMPVTNDWPEVPSSSTDPPSQTPLDDTQDIPEPAFTNKDRHTNPHDSHDEGLHKDIFKPVAPSSLQIQKEIPLPPVYGRGPEPLSKAEPISKTAPASTTNPKNNQETRLPQPGLAHSRKSEPLRPSSAEIVHTKDKVHIPAPTQHELIVKEIFVEREHYIELLSALHIAKHDVEHEITARLNLEATNAKLQKSLDTLYRTLENIQMNTLHIEEELAKHQG